MYQGRFQDKTKNTDTSHRWAVSLSFVNGIEFVRMGVYSRIVCTLKIEEEKTKKP